MPTLEVRPSTIKGQGCFTLVHIQKRKKIAVYAGELIQGKRHVARRLRAQIAVGDVKIISMAKGVAIDAAIGGNATTFINHSCQPNAFMREVPGKGVMFFALREIEAGEEITMDYRDPAHPAAATCRCGAPQCRSRRRARR